MSQFYQYNWIKGTNNIVAQAQPCIANTPLLLNGAIANNSANTCDIISTGSVRLISLTSTSNLSGINFTITGTQNGAFVQRTIAGPNNNTVVTVANNLGVYFDTITSIIPNGNSPNNTMVSVGLGTSNINNLSIGFMPLISLNAGTNAGAPNIGNTSYAIALLNNSNPPTTVTLSCFQSLSQNVNSGSPYTTFSTNTGFFATGNPIVDASNIVQFNGPAWQNLLMTVRITQQNTQPQFTVQFLQI